MRVDSVDLIYLAPPLNSGVQRNLQGWDRATAPRPGRGVLRPLGARL